MAVVVYVKRAGEYSLINASGLPAVCVAEDVPSRSKRVRASTSSPPRPDFRTTA
jgi:hypothetical protein